MDLENTLLENRLANIEHIISTEDRLDNIGYVTIQVGVTLRHSNTRRRNAGCSVV